MNKINLGDKVRDTVTGFTGIAVARTTWLHGCDRITIERDALDNKGMVQDSCVFDDPRVELIEHKPVPMARPQLKTGGPQNDKVALRRS